MTPMQGSKPNTNKILNALLFSNNANMKKGSLSKSQGLKEICKFSISNVYSWSARLMIRYISGLSRDCCWLCCTWMWSISECITEKLNWRHKESNELPSERTFIFSRYSLVCFNSQEMRHKKCVSADKFNCKHFVSCYIKNSRSASS